MIEQRDSRELRPDRQRRLPLRTELELTTDQLAGIDAWHEALRQRAAAEQSTAMTREMRLDLSRRMEVRRTEQAALLERAAVQLEQGAQLLRGRRRPRALLVHRNRWVRDRIAQHLQDGGMDILDLLEDGARASAALIVEQPDLLLVEDRLPSLPGLQVTHRARRFSPATVVAAHLMDGQHTNAFLDAGARAVFTRQVPPAVVAEQALQCLVGAAVP